MTILCAKYYPEAKIVGVDFWGKKWDYTKEKCVKNALIEGVSKQVIFEQGNAANLPYPDNYFDAAISNLVFHEVKSIKDKRDLVREALRVLKKGGIFAFQDMFGQETIYGNIYEFIEILREEGLTEIYYVSDVEKSSFIPFFIRTPWMLYQMGLLYGKK